MKLILDSDILIRHFQRNTEWQLLQTLADRGQWHMSSVVAMELRAGCRSKQDVRTLEKFLHLFNQTGRVVCPNHRMWIRAGSVLADLAIENSKRRTMLNDTLIALSAIAIGAAIVTNNARDFAILADALPLMWFDGVEKALAAMNS